MSKALSCRQRFGKACPISFYTRYCSVRKTDKGSAPKEALLQGVSSLLDRQGWESYERYIKEILQTSLSQGCSKHCAAVALFSCT